MTSPSGSNSLFEKWFLNAFWSKIVSITPLWVSPNSITICGSAQYIITLIIFSLSCEPNQIYRCDEYSSIFYFCLGISTFIQQTLDGVDGTLARKRNKCSKLGELLDHGFDATNLPILVMMGCCSVYFEPGWLLLFIFLSGSAMCYSNFWRVRHERNHFLSAVSLSEVQVIIIFVSFLASIINICNYSDVNIINIFNVDIKLKYFALLLSPGPSINAIINIRAVLTSRISKYKLYNHKFMFIEWFNFILFCLSMIIWNLLNVMYLFPWLYFWTLTFLFSSITHRMIVAGLSNKYDKKEKQVYTTIYLLLFIITFSLIQFVKNKAFIFDMTSIYVVYAICIISFTSMSYYALSIISELYYL